MKLNITYSITQTKKIDINPNKIPKDMIYKDAKKFFCRYLDEDEDEITLLCVYDKIENSSIYLEFN